jgi:predicted nucleic acid-binding protein
MPKLNLFLDSSALFTGIASETGAARVLLLLAEIEHVTVTISEQVVAETERAIARKVPQALNDLREAIKASKVRIVRDPSIEDVTNHLDLISHSADVPILVAAMNDQADYLVTLNRKHFMDDPGVAQRTGVKIVTPGEALSRVRRQIYIEHLTEKVNERWEAPQTRLIRLGISEEWSELLMEAGVKTVDELAQSNAKDLFEGLNTVNEEKKIVRKLPTETQVEEWVEKAKREPRMYID